MYAYVLPILSLSNILWMKFRFDEVKESGTISQLQNVYDISNLTNSHKQTVANRTWQCDNNYLCPDVMSTVWNVNAKSDGKF